jgi:DNA-binding IclR family transcriptional regulator
MQRADDGAGGGAQSLTLRRGLRALRVLSEYPAGLSVSELAAALGTHRAGVYRLLTPLGEERLVRRRDDGRYVLGLGLVELASRVHGRLQEVALPELQRLADELEATTALTVRDGDEAVVTAVVEPRTTDMHVAYRRGLRHRLDQAASGIAILASLPPVPGEREAIIVARERGWSRSSGELLTGATGVGAALSDPGGAEASITAVWIEPRDEPAMAAAVMRAASRITDALSVQAPG